MILLDANILLYAYSESSPHHAPARDWLEKVMTEREDLGLCWPVLFAFLRLSTSPTPYKNSYSMAEAIAIVDELTAESNVTLLHPTGAHWMLLRRLLVESQVSRNLVMDAHLAALAIEHGAALCTNDRDFSRFPGLKIVNPISSQ